MLLIAMVMAALPCPRGFDAVEDACVVAPAKAARLVVYFHGMLPGTTDWARVRELALLGAEARRRGVALVALRGEQGLCAWSDEVRRHWCWPSDLSQRADVERMVERVSRVVGRLGLAGVAPVFAGFSNGGYLTSMIASDTKVEAAGYVVLHAGNVSGEVFPVERARPWLVVGASRDAIQLPVVNRLAAMLEEAKWPVKLVVHDGVHEVTAADAKAVFDFVVERRD